VGLRIIFGLRKIDYIEFRQTKILTIILIHFKFGNT